MEEELNENDLEERLYAMIHHVDATQADENEQIRDAPRVEAPRSTVKRYWRTGHTSAYQKVNTPNAPIKNAPANRTPANVNKNTPAPVNRSHAAAATDPKPKEEKNDAPDSPPAALAILQNTVPQNYTKTVEILEFDDPPNVVELESSDEDEVIEIALPPKPTITIESSDEEEPIVLSKKPKDKGTDNSKENKSPNKSNRDVSASPVHSVVSDDFIRGDYIALTISAQPDSQSFTFSLHGSDLIENDTPSKKKKKKKTKDRVTSTPIINNSEQAIQEINNADNIFATPKSKAKKKKSKTKSYAVSNKIIPNPDVYDSDSNQSVIDITENHDAYVVTETSVSESIRDVGKQPAPQGKTNENDSSDSDVSVDQPLNTTPKNVTDKTLVVDLTNNYTTQIEENIVIGNISGYSDVHEYGDSFDNTALNTENISGYSDVHEYGDSFDTTSEEVGRFCSTKVPQILYEDLDFDNLKGKDKVCRRRRYSLTTLRAEMEKFYNESWGGENFNHQEIQKNMSRDKSLWVIDPKDRMPNPPKRRVACNYCNRVGHRDDTCYLKTPVCHMCGHTGHYEPRCPRKICVNCGSPNFMYSTSCRNCAAWRALQCAECGQPGHPASHCPDLWRRYHGTIDENMPLEQCGEKPQHQQQCSGCARRGHLAHSCRAFRSLCSLAVHPSRVARYRRLYPPSHKRLSAEPAHPVHASKKRFSDTDARARKHSHPEPDRKHSHPEPDRKHSHPDPDRKHSHSEADRKHSESDTRPRKNSQSVLEPPAIEAAPDFIPIGPNRDNKGHVIQDSEVSDTSEVKTSARVYIASDLMRKLAAPASQDWLKQTMEKFNVDVGNSGSFLTVVGTVGDQEAFHSELKSWGKPEAPKKPEAQDDTQQENMMPKKKNDVLRKLNNAFDSLKANIGDPEAILKELTYLQNRHETIKSQKVISPQQLSNNRNHINEMLKKLNMVLLGQAGLAGGAERLHKLQALQEKLINTRQQKVPDLLRSEIYQHYQTIFTAFPRNDYAVLVQKFYTNQPVGQTNSSPGPKKKKKKKMKTNKQQPVLVTNKEQSSAMITANNVIQPTKQARLIQNMTRKLSRFYTMLLQADRLVNNHKQHMERLNITYRILETKKGLSESQGQSIKKQMKKIKQAQKVQQQATAFLNGSAQKK